MCHDDNCHHWGKPPVNTRAERTATATIIAVMLVAAGGLMLLIVKIVKLWMELDR